jgi:L-asparagine transporter-like permease
VAILIHSVLALGLAISGSFVGLMVVSTLAALIVYLICCSATIQLRRMDVRTEGARPFKVPGGPIVPILAVTIVVWLMTASTRQEFVALAAMIVIETLVYFLMVGRRKIASSI